MNVEEMEARIRNLEDELATIRAVHEIEKLQRAYGYYLEHWMVKEIVDCFADDPDVALDFPEGTYLGKERVRESFEGMKHRVGDDPEFLHQLMPVSPVITVGSDGKTARGRWYSFGAMAMPIAGGVKQAFCSGIYENEYVIENGKWKIKRLSWHRIFDAEPGQGWVKPERVAAVDPNIKLSNMSHKTDIPGTRLGLVYPSGYIFPFHFKHPVTGEKTTEEQVNISVKPVKYE
jgi:hypothetical protein